ncbi:cytochrome c oxidase subunit II [Tropicimonas isoalkanivorans]|nr:cytochrome c oxidase subunit II [Tropicimonas isoalkanivorans]
MSGCTGQQSALIPRGEDAAVQSTLFFVMLVGAVVLWLMLNGLFFYLTRVRPGAVPQRLANGMIIIGGLVVPAVLIGALLAWGLSILPDQQRSGDGLTIRVTGEQWWWRVEYWPEGAEAPIVSANEIRMPVGERVEFALGAKRVIHSFWIPALGGKMDMFPGRDTRVSLKATEPGVYRGQCAEFCGASHAWMAFAAEAMPPADFAAWLDHEASAAVAPSTPDAVAGAEIFAREGCGACHTVRGTDHIGQVGPDLTHVGARHTLGAGRLGATLEDFAAWISHTDELKPEVEMPAYGHLPEEEHRLLAAYLKGLQ